MQFTTAELAWIRAAIEPYAAEAADRHAQDDPEIQADGAIARAILAKLA